MDWKDAIIDPTFKGSNGGASVMFLTRRHRFEVGHVIGHLCQNNALE
jgi:hypothetical protein